MRERGSTRRLRHATPALVVAVLIVPIIPVASRLTDVHQQRTAIERVHEAGGHTVGAPDYPRSLSSIIPPRVTGVDLRGASVDRRVIIGVATLPQLNWVDLSETSLEVDAFESLIELTAVHVLSLSKTNVHDEHMASVARLTNLVSLAVDDTAITDAGVKQIKTMPSLRTLDLSGTAVTADGLAALASLSSLEVLTIDERCLTATSAAALSRLPRLETLRVSVASGLGRDSRRLARQLTGIRTEGITSPTNDKLWVDATGPWDETFAGVAEIVAEQAGLSEDERLQLVGVIWATKPPNGWVRSTPLPSDPPPTHVAISSFRGVLRSQVLPRGSHRDVRAFLSDGRSSPDVAGLLTLTEGSATASGETVEHADSTRVVVRGLLALTQHPNSGVASAAVGSLAPLAIELRNRVPRQTP